MTIRNSIHAVLALVLVPAGLEAATIRVWEHENFSGASQVYDSSVARLEGSWNDRISSIRVESGQWEVCRDWDFRSCRTLGVDTPEMAVLGSGWNDAISSLRPVGSAAATTDPQAVAQRLYVALLGREADPEGLRNATNYVRDGRLTELVRGLTSSAEYRSATQGRPASEILDQLYRGLFGRPADNTARNIYLGRIEDGDVEEVVLDLVASNEFASGGGGGAVASPAQTGSGDIDVQARGSGAVVWGAKGYPETVNAAKVHLGADGRFSIAFSGSSNQRLDGTFRRESDGAFRVLTVDLPTKPAITVEDGTILLDNGQLARVDVSYGAQGTRDRVLYTFVSEHYALPAEQVACHNAIRDRIGGDGKLAFLAPEHSRVGSNRERITGEVVILSRNESARYSCEVDLRGDQVLQASVNGR
jgi:hypothetical protein